MERVKWFYLNSTLKPTFFNRRLNVLQKIVIPRTKLSVDYILMELDEQGREEFIRLKRVKDKKKRDKECQEKKTKDAENERICPICEELVEETLSVPNIQIIPTRSYDEVVDKKYLPKQDINEVGSRTKAIEKTTPDTHTHQQPVKIQTPGPIPQPLPSSVCDVCGEERSSPGIKLEQVKEYLDTLMTLGKRMVLAGVEVIDVDMYINMCEKLKLKLEEYFKELKSENSIDENVLDENPLEDTFDTRLEKLKSNLQQVIDVEKNQNNLDVTPSLQSFIHTCKIVDKKLNVYIKEKKIKDKIKKGKDLSDELAENIDNVLTIIEEYIRQGINLSVNAKEFTKSCNLIKSKLDEDPYRKKISHLKEHLNYLEKLTLDMKREGLANGDIEMLTKVCQEFKTKLDQLKMRGKYDTPDEMLDDIVSYMDETVNLAKEVKKEGQIPIGTHINEFIDTIDIIKDTIKAKEKSVVGPDIEGILSMISKMKTEDFDTKILEDYIEARKVKVNESKSLTPNFSSALLPKLNAPCGYDGDMLQRIKTASVNSYNGSCDLCNDNEIQESACEVCSHSLQEEYVAKEDPYLTPVVSKSDESFCDVCTKQMEAGESCPKFEEKVTEPEPQPVDSSMGYFEKKVRKKVKLTRTRNKDGTIREERETITIRKEKHDPTMTSFDDDDDDDDYGSVGGESLLDDDETQVAMCTMPSQRGFMRKVKSDTGITIAPITNPVVGNCISLDSLICCSFQGILSGSPSYRSNQEHG